MLPAAPHPIPAPVPKGVPVLHAHTSISALPAPDSRSSADTCISYRPNSEAHSCMQQKTTSISVQPWHQVACSSFKPASSRASANARKGFLALL